MEHEHSAEDLEVARILRMLPHLVWEAQHPRPSTHDLRWGSRKRRSAGKDEARPPRPNLQLWRRPCFSLVLLSIIPLRRRTLWGNLMRNVAGTIPSRGVTPIPRKRRRRRRHTPDGVRIPPSRGRRVRRLHWTSSLAVRSPTPRPKTAPLVQGRPPSKNTKSDRRESSFLSAAHESTSSEETASEERNFLRIEVAEESLPSPSQSKVIEMAGKMTPELLNLVRAKSQRKRRTERKEEVAKKAREDPEAGMARVDPVPASTSPVQVSDDSEEPKTAAPGGRRRRLVKGLENMGVEEGFSTRPTATDLTPSHVAVEELRLKQTLPRPPLRLTPRVPMYSSGKSSSVVRHQSYSSPSTEIPAPLQVSRLSTCHEAVQRALPSGCTYDNFPVSLDLCHAASLPAEEKHFQEMLDKEFGLRMARISAMGAAFSFHAYERLKQWDVALDKKKLELADLEKLHDTQAEENKRLQTLYDGLVETHRESEQRRLKFERALARSDQELNDLQSKHAELEATLATEVADARLEGIQSFKESAPYKEQVQLIVELPDRLEVERKKAVEEYRASPDFQGEVAEFLVESYAAGYDEGKTRGFKQGLNRAILLARQYISEGQSLDDIDLQGEEYFSGTEMETPVVPSEPEKRSEEVAEATQHSSEPLEKTLDEVAE